VVVVLVNELLGEVIVNESVVVDWVVLVLVLVAVCVVEIVTLVAVAVTVVLA
jgi:hypothetical protein